jgi:CrcB protein
MMTVMSGIKKGWPTVAVNLIGCFLIGLIWGFMSRTQSESSNLALFLMVGICGGFTTFSTFSKDALMMLQNGNIWGFAAYVGTSIIAGIALTAIGYYLTR